ncbi:MAG: tail fiber domain-containing protein [Oscillospiraceae bacterium]|nr:tail fiber domain-containing protein [Oscillospiraceae bacterium]
MTDAIRELFELLTKKEKSGSDYTGTVTRVDGKTAYVQFDGSDITDTPVALSIGAKAGDSVRVRVADGRAWLVGNDDAPPNDSSEVGYQLDLTNARIRELTTEQINGENGWINLLQGTFNYGNRLIWNGSILSLIGKIETSEGKVAGWVIGASTISSGAKGANTALVTLKSGTSGSITVENTYFKSLLDYNGLAMTGDYGETQLTNTGYDIRRKYLGSSTWVHTYITGGSIEVGDSPNQTIIGEGTGDFSGSISEGGTTLAQKYMGMEVANGYWGLKPNGSNAVYVRTTTLGLIPYQSGGSGTLGTSTWPFNTIYGKTIYENGTALSSKYLGFGGGTLSGRLTVSYDGAMIVSANPTYGSVYAGLHSASGGNHGVYSNGYWNGSALAGTGRWMIYRSTADTTCVPSELYTYNEGYTTLRPVIGTNAGGAAVGVIQSSANAIGIYARWGGSDTAVPTGRSIACPSSDIRLKENVEDSTVDALSVIDAIRIRQFDWKDKSRGHWDCGMVVDEMEKDVDPRMCIGGGEDEDGNISYKSVDTFYLQGYEVKAIQELHAEVKSLKAEIAELKEIIAVLMEGKK